MWDVGGSALRGRMLDKYVYGADAVVLVYDVSNFNSFENLQEWLSACKAALLQAWGARAVIQQLTFRPSGSIMQPSGSIMYP